MAVECEQQKLEDAVIGALVEGYLPCAVGLGLAARLGVSPRRVGEIADGLGIRICDCQLGCFKIEKASHDDLKGRVFSDSLTSRIKGAQRGGGLSCRAAHLIARRLGVSPKDVGDAATSLGVRIGHCQLGCFV